MRGWAGQVTEISVFATDILVTGMKNFPYEYSSWQVQHAGHRSQVTENAIKKLDTLLGLLCLFICLICGYVTIKHMFGIDHASRCSKSKRTKVTHCIGT